MRILGQPIGLGVLAAAQIGVPVAAVTVGTQLHVLVPGEAAAMVLGALVTIMAAVGASVFEGRRARPRGSTAGHGTAAG